MTYTPIRDTQDEEQVYLIREIVKELEIRGTHELNNILYELRRREL